MSRPQVIDDEERERVHERVAAVDVAKDAGMVCTRTPHGSRPGARQSTVWAVKARMNAIRKLGRQLARDGIEVTEVDIERDPEAAEFVMSVNGGNQTVPTVVLPDGTTLVNPSAAQVRERLAAVSAG